MLNHWYCDDDSDDHSIPVLWRFQVAPVGASASAVTRKSWGCSPCRDRRFKSSKFQGFLMNCSYVWVYMKCNIHTYITLHYITLNYITLHYITLITLHYITYIHTYHYITLHYNTLHYITLYTLHYITLHYITWHYITSHYITSHDITSHYITLH